MLDLSDFLVVKYGQALASENAAISFIKDYVNQMFDYSK